MGHATQTIHHNTGGNRTRLSKVHQSIITENNKQLFVTDMGLDKIFLYEFNPEKGRVTAQATACFHAAFNSGPRHMELSKDNKRLYVIHQKSGTLTYLSIENNQLQQVQSLSALPEDYMGKIWSADIHLSPDENFLYITHRDDLNEIVQYKIDPVDGTLAFLRRYPTGQKTPRYFTITPNGNFLLAGHENGDTIFIFNRDLLHGT